jgi:hypothetical protein
VLPPHSAELMARADRHRAKLASRREPQEETRRATDSQQHAHARRARDILAAISPDAAKVITLRQLRAERRPSRSRGGGLVAARSPVWRPGGA